MFSKRFGPALSVLALGTAVPAQEAGPGGRAATEVLNGIGLLSRQTARAELGLSPRQIDEIRKLGKDYVATTSERLRPFVELPRDEYAVKAEPIWQELAADANRRLVEILDAWQYQRYRQFMRQRKGYAAFLDPEVQEALELTDEQKARVVSIRDRYRDQSHQILATSKDDRQAALSRLREASEKANAEALALLTDDQKKLWADLVGPEFQEPGAGGVPRQPAKP